MPEHIFGDDDHDLGVLYAGIYLSSTLRSFLMQNAQTFDRLVDAGVLDRRLLELVRKAASEMEGARSARVRHARSAVSGD